MTGYGLDALRTAVFHALKATENAESLVVAGTAQRCGESLRLAEQALVRGKQLNQSQQGEELVAAEIHLALQELGKVVGAVYTDDILDRIFSRFCIGK